MSTLFSIYLLDFVLLQLAQLSKCLQTEKLDRSIISSLVDAVLHILDNVFLPATNWVLALHDAKDVIETTIVIKFGCADIAAFRVK